MKSTWGENRGRLDFEFKHWQCDEYGPFVNR